MTAEQLAILVDQLGAPQEMFTYPNGEPMFTKTFVATGEGQYGTFQTFTVPATALYRFHIRGAAGSLGSWQRTDGTSFPGRGGYAANVYADIALTMDDELLLVVGQMGTNTNVPVVSDGSGGAGGGGTFVLRRIAAITDSRYQVTLAGIPYECLLVAAGGGGSQDNAYRKSALNGYEASTILRSLANFKAFSTVTQNPATNNSTTSTLSLSQLAAYNGSGCYYMRNSNYCYGGFGGGGVRDDGFSYGGGWANEETYRAGSWAKEGGTLILHDTAEHGIVEISYMPVDIAAWWQPVFDRTLDDCVYGNPKGSITFQTLNRIEADTEFLIQRFRQCWIWYDQNVFVQPAKWLRTLYFRISELNRIKQNIINIRKAKVVNIDTPMLTTGSAEDPQHYTTFNDMERILFDIYDSLQRLIDDWLYCGMFYPGGSVDDQHFDNL
jgi:hypothetical protein